MRDPKLLCGVCADTTVNNLNPPLSHKDGDLDSVTPLTMTLFHFQGKNSARLSRVADLLLSGRKN